MQIIESFQRLITKPFRSNIHKLKFKEFFLVIFRNILFTSYTLGTGQERTAPLFDIL